MIQETERILERIGMLEAELAQLRQQVASSLVRRDLDAGDVSVMTCRVGGQRFGLLLDDIDEVLPVAQLTPLPEADPWILGVLNLRGESVVVVDVMQRLLERSHSILETEFIAACRVGQRRIGLLVEEVLDIETIASGNLRHPAPGVTFAPYLIGIVHDGERFQPLLDAGKLMSGAISSTTPAELGESFCQEASSE